MSMKRGIQMPAGDGPTGMPEKPNGHTRVCNAAYIGLASRGKTWERDRNEIHRLAVELMTTNPEEWPGRL